MYSSLALAAPSPFQSLCGRGRYSFNTIPWGQAVGGKVCDDVGVDVAVNVGVSVGVSVTVTVGVAVDADSRETSSQ